MPSYENAYLILDAQRLLLQYERRNNPHWALDVEERKRWAAEMCALARRMTQALEATKPWGPTPSDRHGEWQIQYRKGERGITDKGWHRRHPKEWERIRLRQSIEHHARLLQDKDLRHCWPSLRERLALLKAAYAKGDGYPESGSAEGVRTSSRP